MTLKQLRDIVNNPDLDNVIDSPVVTYDGKPMTVALAGEWIKGKTIVATVTPDPVVTNATMAFDKADVKECKLKRYTSDAGKLTGVDMTFVKWDGSEITVPMPPALLPKD